MVGEPAPTELFNCILDYLVARGRVYKIIDFRQLWLVNPPLQNYLIVFGTT